VPDLPEVGRWRLFLRRRAVGHAVARTDLVAINVLKTFDPPITALAGVTGAG